MKNLKAYIAGLLTGLALLCVPIYADGIWDTISVITNGVQIKVDGVAVDAPNFVYNDTTYVPLRKIAEMVGKPVTWVEEENTAYIGAVPVKDDNTPVATVNDVPITASELIATAYNSAKSQAYMDTKPVTDDAKLVILDEVVRAEAVNQYALKQGFTILPTEEETLMSQINSQSGNEAVLQQSHMSFNTFKDLSIKYYKYGAYIKSIMATLATDAEAKDYYDKNQAEFKDDSYTSKHILINTVDANGVAFTGDALKAAETKANDIYKRITQGEDFDKLMNEFSEDPGLATNPDGYIFDRNEAVVPEYTATAYSLKPGEVSKPVKSDAGYHIIKLISFNVGIKPFEMVSETIKNDLATKKYLLLEDDIMSKSNIVIINDEVNKIVLN